MQSLEAVTEDVAVEAGRVEAQLLRHPQLLDAVVLVTENSAVGKELVAYVVPHPVALQGLRQEIAHTARTAIVDRWKKLYEITYSAAPAAPSFVGWNSSYTRQPIPKPEMEEWLQGTVARIQALKPNKVLEIGCGVGLVLQHLAPQCARYVGVDFSAAGLAQLGRWIGGRKQLRHVELLHRPATELQDIESGSFDTVVMNSVVQYFPDIDYLLTVLQEASRVLSPGGNIFIGDVRNLPLLPTFHSAVQLSRAADDVTAGELRRRALRAEAQEIELVIDPQFFTALPAYLAEIGGAEVELKRGSAHNELTRYRYDVVLHKGTRIEHSTPYQPLDWKTVAGGLAQAEDAVRARRWEAVRLTSIPNRRLSGDVAARRAMDTSDERVTAGELRRSLERIEPGGVDPETLWEGARVHDYDIRVSWGSQEPECFDAQLVDRDRGDRSSRTMPVPTGEPRPCNTYANNPSENSAGQRLILQLHEYLRGRLPDCRVPSGWTVLKRLLRTPDGEVDRRGL